MRTVWTSTYESPYATGYGGGTAAPTYTPTMTRNRHYGMRKIFIGLTFGLLTFSRCDKGTITRQPLREQSQDDCALTHE